MWRCLLLSCLLVRCFPVTGPSLLCSSAVALLVCRWSIVGLLESVLLSCRCPVAVLSLSCRWSTAGLSARVRGRSSISSVAGLSARVGVADASLMCRWSVSALSLFCRYSARVMVAVTGLSLVHRCHWSVAGSSLLCHWSVAGSSLLCHWSVAAVTDLSARAMVTDPSVVCRSFAPRPSDRPSLLVCPLLRLLVCLLARRLSVCWSVACLSARPSLSCLLVCLLARRCSSVADTLLVCLLVHHWLSLSCTCSWSLVCLLVRLLPSPRPSPRPSLVTGRSARVRVAAPWLVCCSSVTYPWLVMVARASARSSRVALPLLRLLVHHWPVCSSVAFLSAVRSPVCLLEPWSLARRSSICCPSLLRLLES